MMRTNHADRYVALIIDPAGEVLSVAKVALDEAGDAALGAEADRDRDVRQAPIRTRCELRGSSSARPECCCSKPCGGLLGSGPGCFRPTLRSAWVGRSQRPRTEAISAWHMETSPPGISLRAPDGWVLIDWEDSRADAPPFYDLFHYLVQGAVLLRRPSLRAFTGGAPGTSWMRDAIRAYAEGAGRPASTWRRHLGDYLRLSMEDLDRSDAEQAKGLAARQRLLRSIV